MTEVNMAFFKNLDDHELYRWYKETSTWSHDKYNQDHPTWIMCDKYEDEYGGNFDIADMHNALLEEIAKRFVLLIDAITIGKLHIKN